MHCGRKWRDFLNKNKNRLFCAKKSVFGGCFYIFVVSCEDFQLIKKAPLVRRLLGYFCVCCAVCAFCCC